jgi:hypothetical protein
MALVSIGLPAFNRVQTPRQAIANLRRQTFVDFDLPEGRDHRPNGRDAQWGGSLHRSDPDAAVTRADP